MTYLISWLASAFGGFLTVVFLVVGWGAILATVMAVIGVIRRRCAWYSILMYVALIPIGSLLFKGVFWVLARVAQPDTVSTALFWGAVFISGLGALFSAGPKLLKEVWQVTNNPGNLTEPLLTGKQWLSWPLEKKQAVVAHHLTRALTSVGGKKEFRPEEVSSQYIDSIDRAAQDHPDDPRMNKFIENFIKELRRRLTEGFKRMQAEK
jgi:hypothetical protein